MMRAWLWAFVFTELIETPIYARSMPSRPWAQRLAIGFGASAITHPLVWLGMLYVIPGGYLTRLVSAELFAFAVEALWLWRWGVPNAWLWSLVANGTSLGIGTLTRAIWGWP
jgi:hypothetical protein